MLGCPCAAAAASAPNGRTAMSARHVPHHDLEQLNLLIAGFTTTSAPTDGGRRRCFGMTSVPSTTSSAA